MSADLEAFGASTLVVCSADHVFNMDLAPVIEEHLATGRVGTVLTKEVTKRDAADNVVVLARGDGTVTGVEHKPSRPSGTLVATEIFIYDTAVLLSTLRALRAELSGDQEGDDSGLGDFGEHLLPRLIETGKVVSVPMTGYWRDVGQPRLYLQSHRDLLAGKVDVFDHKDRPVISHWPDRPAARVRDSGSVSGSLLSPGCDVSGQVVDSVLGPGVVIEKGSVGGVAESRAPFDDGAVVGLGGRLPRGPDTQPAALVVSSGAVRQYTDAEQGHRGCCRRQSDQGRSRRGAGAARDCRR